jgi:hypothetical protein
MIKSSLAIYFVLLMFGSTDVSLAQHLPAGGRSRQLVARQRSVLLRELAGKGFSTKKNMQTYADSKWIDFWRNLRVGYDWFADQGHIPPDVAVHRGRYRFKGLGKK